MIRVVGRRTGVEVLGTEIATMVPLERRPNPTLQAQLAKFDLVVDESASQLALVNPYLWTHEILGADGQLVLSDGLGYSDVVGDIATATGMARSKVLQQFFAGITPGQERWFWNSPWPDQFSLRGAEYLTFLRDLTGGPCYKIGEFDLDGPLTRLGGPTRSFRQSFHNYVILTQGEPVGALVIPHNESKQSWFARPSALAGALLPPGTEGIWTFEKVDRFRDSDQYLSLELPVETNTKPDQ